MLNPTIVVPPRRRPGTMQSTFFTGPALTGRIAIAGLRLSGLVLAGLMLAGLSLATAAIAADGRSGMSQNGMSQNWEGQKELWLFGGGEKICSSIEPEYCVAAKAQQAADFFAAAQARHEKSYACTAQSRQLLATVPQWPALPEQNQQPANAGARRTQVLQALPTIPLGAKAFADALRTLQLNDDEQALVEDACERAPTGDISIYWPGTDPITQQMFRQLVQAGAARSGDPAKKPLLLLITASSYNPYEWVSYYRQLFSAAGAEVRWLPIEAAWSQQPQPDCSAIETERLYQSGQLRRAEIYPAEAREQQQACLKPALLEQWVDAADLVFINGGDQSLTLRALTDRSGAWTPLASRLLQRVRQQGVILAGSSAGNAVQAGRPDATVAMISGGRQLAALQEGALATEINSPGCAITSRCHASLAAGQLTYRPQGGLQLFSLGINDTHFYQRSREARLLRLVLDSGSAAGFGVDEATVLRARFKNDDHAELSVLGHGGVWLLDAGNASGQLPSVRTLSQIQSGPARASRQARLQQLSVSRMFAGDVLHYRRPANGRGAAQIDVRSQSCQPTAVNPADLDASAYAPVRGVLLQSEPARPAKATLPAKPALHWQLQWQLQAPVQGCLRSDGRWQYLQQQLSVQLTLASVADDVDGNTP